MKPVDDHMTPCPSCSKPVRNDERVSPFYPFCSKRCRMADLDAWLNESYVISRPIEQADLDQGE